MSFGGIQDVQIQQVVEVVSAPHAVVYKKGNKVIAKDRDDVTIASGVAGIDDHTVIDAAIDSLQATGGKLLIKSGTYVIPSGTLPLYQNVIIEGEGTATIIDYNGSSVCFSGTDLDFGALRDLKIVLADSAVGGILVGENTTYFDIERVLILGEDNTVAGQYGIRLDAGDTWCYDIRIKHCTFQVLNKGIVTITSGAQAANAAHIIDPIFYLIGSIGIDFSADQSLEHTVLGGFWSGSASGAVGFKSNGIRNHFMGCQLEMGVGTSSFVLGANSDSNVIIINDNCPGGNTLAGVNHSVDVGHYAFRPRLGLGMGIPDNNGVYVLEAVSDATFVNSKYMIGRKDGGWRVSSPSGGGLLVYSNGVEVGAILENQLRGTITELAADPTTSNLAAGKWSVFKNTTSGDTYVWINDGGTMKKVGPFAV